MSRKAPPPPPKDQKAVEIVDQFDKQLTSWNTVRHAQDYIAFATSLIQVKLIQKHIEGREEQITEPAKALRETAKAWFGDTKAKLNAIEAKLRGLLEQYVDERVVQAAADSTAALEAGNTEAMLAAMSAVPAVQGISVATVVDFEVDSEDEIPPEYWKRELDANKIRKALRNGEKVPGVTRVERSRLSVSTGKGEVSL